MNPEQLRIEDSRLRKAHWNRWGPFLSARSWGTVREDYSADGDAWDYFPFDHARYRTYRWNEDGLAGICDRHERICFGIALWNGRDPFLKERLFGLSGPQGNHGEDVKEYYFYLDNTPTHSYMKMLYKYPQAAFPYERLVEENRRRSRDDPEFELIDTGVFAENRYFDVFVEYAKATPEAIAIRIQVVNRGPEKATLHVLPTVWFRNRWSWGGRPEEKPELRLAGNAMEIREPKYGLRYLCWDRPGGLSYFTENESNRKALWGVENRSAFVKDGIDACVVRGDKGAVNPAGVGTKAAIDFTLELAPGASETIELRLSDSPTGEPAEQVFADRKREADLFYGGVIPRELGPDGSGVMRQAFAGLLWSKQTYRYVVRDWLAGDPAFPPPPPERRTGRNADWSHLYNSDVLSMPDKWEYPWYAAWDLAFHTIPLSLIDSQFATYQ